MQEYIGYGLAVLVGFSLGLIGGGGSILTVPILVYVMNVPPTLATSYSLFIVGMTSLVGFYNNFKKKHVNFRVGLWFGIPALIAVYVTRRFIVPSIPHHLFYIGSIDITRDVLIMTVFAFLMLLSAYKMIKPETFQEKIEEAMPVNYSQLVINGLIVGLITGFVGAGGGFLIVPALVFLAHLPMKKAIGTSLMIISINCLFGFIGSMQSMPNMNYSMLLTFTFFAIIGVLVGTQFSERVPAKTLKVGFGYFILFMGTYIIIRELFL